MRSSIDNLSGEEGKIINELIYGGISDKVYNLAYEYGLDDEDVWDSDYGSSIWYDEGMDLFFTDEICERIAENARKDALESGETEEEAKEAYEYAVNQFDFLDEEDTWEFMTEEEKTNVILTLQSTLQNMLDYGIYETYVQQNEFDDDEMSEEEYNERMRKIDELSDKIHEIEHELYNI